MLVQVVRQLNAQNSLREAVDAAAEREAMAIATHNKEHRSVFCPIRSAHVRAEDFATILGGAALSGTISYIKF